MIASSVKFELGLSLLFLLLTSSIQIFTDLSVITKCLILFLSGIGVIFELAITSLCIEIDGRGKGTRVGNEFERTGSGVCRGKDCLGELCLGVL